MIELACFFLNLRVIKKKGKRREWDRNQEQNENRYRVKEKKKIVSNTTVSNIW